MAMNADAYKCLLRSLLPQGAAWPIDDDTDLLKTISALSKEFERIDQRVDQLMLEIDPRTSSELLNEYENALGLPDNCITSVLTFAERRQNAFVALTLRSIPNVTWLVSVAKNIGFDITITNPSPNVWQVNAPTETLQLAEYGNTVYGDPYRKYGREQILECTMMKLNRAHATVQFNYG